MNSNKLSTILIDSCATDSDSTAETREMRGCTWTVWTSLLVSSSAASSVDVEKERAPRCSPRTTRPSFRYCSTGSTIRSRRPCTANGKHNTHQFARQQHIRVTWNTSPSRWRRARFLFSRSSCNIFVNATVLLAGSRQHITSWHPWQKQNTTRHLPQSSQNCSREHTNLHQGMHGSNSTKDVRNLVLHDVIVPLLQCVRHQLVHTQQPDVQGVDETSAAH